MNALRTLVRQVVPVRARLALRRLIGDDVTPPPGHVRFGDLRRIAPISSDFGYRRGNPVDRYYIEAFLQQHRADVRGRVLEVGDSTYTHRFGATAVSSAEVLHVDPDAPGATYVGDLGSGTFLPTGAFDCIIFTQTLHLIYDFGHALRELGRALAPGGVLLVTVPGISNVDAAEWGSTWHYAFTQHSVRRMFADNLPGIEATFTSAGNVLAAVAFLQGLSSRELTEDELDAADPSYGLIHAVRAVKQLS